MSHYRAAEIMGLWFTNACNLNCTYCYIKNKSDDTISFDTAVNLIEKALSSDGGAIDFYMMGAETLTRFDELRRIVETINSREWKRDYRFFITTNGTLLTEDMKEWFRANRERVCLGLSYDGDDMMQNCNRSNSAYKIDKDFFLETWRKQPWKVTISSETAPYIDRGLIELHKKGARFTANVAYEDEPWSDDLVRRYEAALFRLAEHYADNPEIEPCNLFASRPSSLLGNVNEKQRAMCSAGSSFYFYDMQGKAYPCQMMSPLVMPEEKALRLKRFPDDCDYEDPRCAECVLKHGCHTCMGENYLHRGDIRLRDETHCKTTQAEVRALMHMHIRKLRKKTTLTAKEKKDVEAMMRINKAFSENKIGMRRSVYERSITD